jgi:heptosyltransferase-2
VTSPTRILVRLPTWVGDAVMATPALRALRVGHPSAEIVVEGRPLLGDLMRGVDSFDTFLADDGHGVLSRRRRLAERRFELAVLLPDSLRAALAPFLARIPQRVGYARDPLRRALLTDALRPPRENGRRLPIPMLERYLAITRRLGCEDAGDHLDLAVDPEAVERVDKQLSQNGVGTDEGLLVVTPGAGFGPSKLWPPEHFARACDAIAREHGLRPVLAPAPNEVEIAGRIAARSEVRPVSLGGARFGIAELKALIARAQLVLSNDTGPRHIAVALDRPVVVLMGPTDPRHTATHLARQRVLREPVACSPCQRPTCPIDQRCLRRIDPERAAAAATELLGSA